MSELAALPTMTLMSDPPEPPPPDASAPVPPAPAPDAPEPLPLPSPGAPGSGADAGPGGAHPAPRQGLFARATGLVFGLAGLLVGLSVLASIPILQLAVLGWLLECEGRLGRGGRLREALPGLGPAARLGSALLGGLLVAIPWLVLRSYAADAALLDPGSPTARTLAVTTLVVGLLTLLHSALALAQGAKLRHFLFPPLSWMWLLGPGPGALAREARPRARAALAALRPAHYLGLGTMGFLAGFAWLLVPCAVLAAATRAPGLLLLGLPLLALVLPWLLMAQAGLAAEARFGAAFELGEVRRRIARAPFATLLAVIVVLGPALPLFLLKLEPLPRDARWLPALVFLVALLPGRLVTGWAWARGGRPGRAHWVLRWPVRALIWPAAGAYVLALFFNQYFDWQGTAGLFFHHAFLLPVAFP